VQHSLATHGFAAQVIPAGSASRELVSPEQSKSSSVPSALVSAQVGGTVQHSLATHGFAAQVIPAGSASRELVSPEQSKLLGVPSASVSPHVLGITVQVPVAEANEPGMYPAAHVAVVHPAVVPSSHVKHVATEVSLELQFPHVLSAFQLPGEVSYLPSGHDVQEVQSVL
jgi:hypothetical protein